VAQQASNMGIEIKSEVVMAVPTARLALLTDKGGKDALAPQGD